MLPLTFAGNGSDMSESHVVLVGRLKDATILKWAPLSVEYWNWKSSPSPDIVRSPSTWKVLVVPAGTLSVHRCSSRFELPLTTSVIVSSESSDESVSRYEPATVPKTEVSDCGNASRTGVPGQAAALPLTISDSAEEYPSGPRPQSSFCDCAR